MRVLMWEHFAPGGPIRVAGHHFAERFARRGARVAWCVGPVSPINFLKSNEETRARLDLWRRGGREFDGGALFAYAPMTLVPYRPYPLFDSRAALRMTLRATMPRLRRVLERAGFDRVDLLWMSPGSPLTALMDEVPHEVAVYRMSDDTAHFPDAPRSFRAAEKAVCRRADLVVATARRLAALARDLGARRVLHLPNACDPDRFMAAVPGEPSDLAPWPRPRAIYAGAIDSWFDTGLVADVARRLPGWSFVLIGPQRAPLEDLRRLRNVALLGPRPYRDLPAYLRAADAGIVPFGLTPMTHAIHPIKVYEYCAAGLPVVATPMDETAAMGAPLRVAAGGEPFAAGLREALDGGPATRQARLDFARRNSWDRRFDRVQEELEALLGTPPREEARVAC